MFLQNFISLQTLCEKGPVAEWLGTGLQNRRQRFDSARDLTFISPIQTYLLPRFMS